MNPSKNLLVIAYYFPPMGTIAFLRNYHITKYLSKLFSSTHLITIKNISLPLKDNISIDFVKEHRVLNYDYRNVSNLLSSGKKNIRKGANAKSKSIFIKFFRKILDSFPTNILFGEGGILYIINGTIKGISIIKKQNITHIYSSYRPIADHVIAFNLKKIFPRLNWIADFKDLPVDDNRDNVYLKKLQWWFNKKLISKANKVITVSEGLNEVLQQIRPDVITLRNGIYRLFEKNENNKYNKFTISYTGSLNTEWQKPNVFFRVIKKIIEHNLIDTNSFQIMYAGKDSKIWNEWITEFNLEIIAKTIDETTLFESIKIQNKSHINLLLSWAGKNLKGILTGKFYEYLATKNPILTLIKGERDSEFEQIFEELKVGYIIYEKDENVLEQILLTLYNEWKEKGKLNFSPNQKILNNYSWENRFQQLKKLI